MSSIQSPMAEAHRHIDLRPKQIDNRPRPPYLPAPTKERCRRTAVTMAAGFRCSDGVILFADTELTYPESLKYQGSTKVRTYEDKETDITVALTGAGDWDYLCMAFEKVLRRIPTAGDQVDTIFDAVEEVLIQIFETNIALSPVRPRPGFDLFAAVRTPTHEFGLFKSADVAFRRGFDIEMSGVGKLLGLYLADMLYDYRMSVKQGLFLAAYILRVANKYVTGVGGKSDIITITKADGLKKAFGFDVSHLQDHFDEFDSYLSPLILAVPDVPDSNATELQQSESRKLFEEKLQYFVTRIKEIRKTCEDEQSPFAGL